MQQWVVILLKLYLQTITVDALAAHDKVDYHFTYLMDILILPAQVSFALGER